MEAKKEANETHKVVKKTEQKIVYRSLSSEVGETGGDNIKPGYFKKEMLNPNENMKYLEFYKECIVSGILPDDGLCHVFGDYDPYLKIITPDDTEINQLKHEGLCSGWWASGLPEEGYGKNGALYTFTPLRQNIVLLMAAMNNEL